MRQLGKLCLHIGANLGSMLGIIAAHKHGERRGTRRNGQAEDMGTDGAVGKEEAEYILPESASRLLTEADLENLTQEDLRIARNEIYARHGRKFLDEGLQEYFNGKSWYNGTIEPDDFKEDMLSEIERTNEDTIVNYETKMGYR